MTAWHTHHEAPCGRDLADADREVWEDNMAAEYAYEMACAAAGLEPWDHDGGPVFMQPPWNGRG